MSDREQYVLADVTAGERDVAALCSAVMDALRDTTVTAHVDAYSDFDEQMPADIHDAAAWLRARGLAASSTDPGAAIPIESSDEVGWAIARAYAPWSTRVALFDADDVNIATFHDGGQFVTVNLTRQQGAAVAAAVAPLFAMLRLADSDPAGTVDPSQP